MDDMERYAKRTVEYLEKQLKIKMDVIAELDKWHKTDKDNIALMVAENTMLKEKIVAQDVAIKNLQQELYDLRMIIEVSWKCVKTAVYNNKL